MSILALDRPVTGLQAVLRELDDGDRVVHVEHLAAKAARFAPLKRPLRTALTERLAIDGFWSHQARAIDLARSGRSVVVATGTASGKSLCFQVPIADSVRDPIRPG